MSDKKSIYLGVDGGATTSKVNGVWDSGEVISTKLLQRPTNSHGGREAVIASWIDTINIFLQENSLNWSQVKGMGLSIPGPYLSYGVFDKTPNLPASFAGWDVHTAFSQALAQVAGHPLPLVCGNDGNFGGVAEAGYARGTSKATVLMLMPGSGLGAAYIGADGLPLEGDTLAGMEAGHMPAALHLLGGIKPFTCGCGKDWGCVEAYTTISGLPQLLAVFLPKYPNHELHTAPGTPKEKALSLRGRAQKGDALALEIFDFQAKALGIHVANLAMAVDPAIVVIGGGLMDPEATSKEFRDRYLRGVREAAAPYFWSAQRNTIKIAPAILGDLSQAIGAGMVAMLRDKQGRRA